MDRDPSKYQKSEVIEQLDYSKGLNVHLERRINVWSTYSVIYYSIFLISLGTTFLQLFKLIREGTFSEQIISASIGVTFGVISIIPHELIHALAYKIIGASDIQFNANWRELYFTTAVHDFVITTNEYIFIALSPLVVILSLAILILQGQTYMDATLFFILIHLSICKGDISMINMITQKHRKIKFIYSDSNNKKIYLLALPN